MKRNGHEIEFLPACLELEESPASPAGRITLWLIVLLFSSGIAWASIGQVDVVTVAQGKVIPNGYTKQIQSMEIATVKAIHVENGQRVKRGDILIELDDKSAMSDVQRISQERYMLEKDKNRINGLLSALGYNVSVDDDSTLDDLGNAQWQEFTDARQKLVSVKKRLKIAQKTLQVRIDKFQQLLPILTKKSQNYKKLSSMKMLAEQQYLETEQQRIEVEHELKSLHAKKAENGMAIKEANDGLQHHTSEFRQKLLHKLDENSRKTHSTVQELIKAKQRVDLLILKSPVDGVVQQLVVHTIGGVVTPAQSLMVIVPEQTTLEIEALFQNKDIGFVEKGMPVDIKIDAFPYTRYGLVEGRITHISRDAISDKAMGLVYKARITLNSSQVSVKDKKINLSPGMTVSAETKTGKRRLIEYFLSPLMRYRDESIRER